MPPREIAERDEFDEHRPAAQGADDGGRVPAFAVQVEDFFAEFFEVANLCFEFVFWIFADARATREHHRGWERGDAFQRGDDLPDVAALAQGAVVSSDEEIACEQPAAIWLVETDVIGTVAWGVENFETAVIGFDPRLIRERTGVARLRPAPHDFAIGMEWLFAARVGQNGKGERVGEDFQSRVLVLQQSVRADVVFVGVGVDEASRGRVFQRVGEFGRGVGASTVNEETVHEVGGCPVAAAAREGPREIEAGEG